MAVYLAAVAMVTLTPATEGGHSPIWYVMQVLHRIAGLGWVTEPQLELAANVVMFVPLGLLGVPLVGRPRWWWVIVAGALLTCFIETVQLGVPGRVSDVRDLVANTSGAALGTAACLAVYWLRARRRRAVPQT